MPTKRQRRPRYRRPTDLESMTVQDRMYGFCWGRGLPGRFGSWADAIDVYLSVRQELLECRDAVLGRERFNREPFIERVYQRWGEQGPPPGWRCPEEALGWSADEWDAAWDEAEVRDMNAAHQRAVLAVLKG